MYFLKFNLLLVLKFNFEILKIKFKDLQYYFICKEKKEFFLDLLF
jgi:hypothetical protein